MRYPTITPTTPIVGLAGYGKFVIYRTDKKGNNIFVADCYDYIDGGCYMNNHPEMDLRGTERYNCYKA